MKLSKAYTVLLIVLVLLSSVLMYLSMFQPRRNTSTETAVIGTTTNEKSIKSIFEPYQIVMKTTQTQERISSLEPELIEKFVTIIDGEKLTNVREKKVVERALYFNYLEQDGIQLIFPTNVTFDMTSHFFDFSLSNELAQDSYTRVLLTFQNGEEKLYFLDDVTYTVYQMNWDTTTLQPIFDELFKQNSSLFRAVQTVEMKQVYDYLPVNEVSLLQQEYVVERMNPIQYTKLIYGNTSDIKNLSSESEYRYTNNTSDLTIQKDTGVLAFKKISGSETPAVNIKKNMRELLKYEKWDARLLYEANHNGEWSVRRYLMQYPLFSDGIDFGKATIKLNNAELLSLNVSTLLLQSHLSARDKPIQLSQYSQIAEQFAKKQVLFTTIEGLRIGYTVTFASPLKEVVTLRPEWYVKVDGNWQSLATYLK